MNKGIVLFFTGLSGAGKSTIADALVPTLSRLGRTVTLLDGDVVRQNLSKGLGFSKEDRDTNILRIGYVANEVVRHGGIVVCAAIAPYADVRDQVRAMIEPNGVFVEVYVSTSLELCEERDCKGLYAKARSGEIPTFTGVSDPYEPPTNPELTLDTQYLSVDQSVDAILKLMGDYGVIEHSEVDASLDLVEA